MTLSEETTHDKDPRVTSQQAVDRRSPVTPVARGSQAPVASVGLAASVIPFGLIGPAIATHASGGTAWQPLGVAAAACIAVALVAGFRGLPHAHARLALGLAVAGIAALDYYATDLGVGGCFCSNADNVANGS